MKRTAFLMLAVATSSAAAQQSIKPRPLGAVQATSKELLGLPTLARPLPNGSVIVNDAARRRLLLLDPSLESYSVIADSTSGSVNGYGPRPGTLIPYVADSSLFLDAAAGSFLVIDPAGKVTRVMSAPRPGDISQLASTTNGIAGFDAKGRMVYRSSYRPQMQQLRDGSIQMSTPPDSAPLLRVDLDTRRADTLTHLRMPPTVAMPISLPNGATMNMQMPKPLAAIDDWAVLSDGTIAVIHGRDYRVDFIQADGSKRTSDKIAFDWKRLSDDDKVALIDSIQKSRAAGPALGGPGGGPQIITSFGAGGGGGNFVVGGGGGQMMTREMVTSVAAGAVPAGAPAAAAAPAAGAAASSSSAGAGSSSSASGASAAGGSAPAAGSAAGGPSTFSIPAIPAPAIADLPDYMPVFTQAAARADADAHVWVRTTTPGAQPGNVVYDVIDNTGTLVDRVDVPKGMQIVGFGKGGVVYLSQREGYGFRILKASIK